MVNIFVILQYSEAVRIFKSCRVVQCRVRGPYQRGLSAQQQVAVESLKTSDTFSSSSKSILFQNRYFFKIDTFSSSSKSVLFQHPQSRYFFIIFKVEKYQVQLIWQKSAKCTPQILSHYLQSGYLVSIFKVR